MKRVILAVILLLSAVFCAFGQNSGPIDLVLLLDTSTSMGSSYDKVNDYITGSFLSEFLRTGDTFHLITFSANPRLDIARRITARGDVETIIGRMLIQYPVETGANPSAAVNYVESYIATLPPRPKKIVMVSAAGPDTSNVINSAKQRFSSKNATFDFVSVTGAVPGSQNLSNPPGSGRSPAPGTRQPSSGASAQQSGASSGTQSAGSSQTNQGGSSGAQRQTQETTQGSTQQGTQPSAQGGAQSSGQAQGTTQGTSQGTTGTQSSSQGDTDTQSTQQSGGAVSSSQQDSSGAPPDNRDSTGAYSTQKKQREPFTFNPTLPLIIGIIAAILLILIIILVSRRLGSSPNRVMASVSATPPLSMEKEDRFADHSKDLASYAARQNKQRETPYHNRPIRQNFSTSPVVINPTGPLLLNLFVEDQNTAIGKRNIHSLKSGYSLTVGGGRSDDFMIFLVPLPSHLGDIRRNGSQLTFIPRKPKYFPDIGSNEVKDCINKRIRVVSDKHYEMWFSFITYEDPLAALNRVLHSIKVPG